MSFCVYENEKFLQGLPPYEFDESKDFEEQMQEAGYKRCEFWGDVQGFYLEVYSGNGKSRYSYVAILNLSDSVCHEVGFEHWSDYLHFLKQYKSLFTDGRLA